MSRDAYRLLFLTAYFFFASSALWCLFWGDYAKAAAMAAFAVMNQAHYRDVRDRGVP